MGNYPMIGMAGRRHIKGKAGTLCCQSTRLKCFWLPFFSYAHPEITLNGHYTVLGAVDDST